MSSCRIFQPHTPQAPRRRVRTGPTPAGPIFIAAAATPQGGRMLRTRASTRNPITSPNEDQPLRHDLLIHGKADVVGARGHYLAAVVPSVPGSRRGSGKGDMLSDQDADSVASHV